MLAVGNCRLIIDVYTITKLININKTTCNSVGYFSLCLSCVVVLHTKTNVDNDVNEKT